MDIPGISTTDLELATAPDVRSFLVNADRGDGTIDTGAIAKDLVVSILVAATLNQFGVSQGSGVQYYAATADGLAATDEGGLFFVYGSDPNAVVILYKKVGGAAVSQGAIPARTFIDAVKDATDVIALRVSILEATVENGDPDYTGPSLYDLASDLVDSRVATGFAELKAGAPPGLDTLGEIAAALNNDPDVLDGFAPRGRSVVAVAANRAVTPADIDKVLLFTATVALTLDPGAGFGEGHRPIVMANRTTSSIQIQPSAGEQVDGGSLTILGPKQTGEMCWIDGQWRWTVRPRMSMRVTHEAVGPSGAATQITATPLVTPINTIRHNTMAGALLSGNQIMLPVGAFDLEAARAYFSSSTCVSVLWDATNNVEVARGEPVVVSNSIQAVSTVKARIYNTAPRAIELRYTSNAAVASGLGNGVAGVSYVYAHIDVDRIG